jgi:hypothetical protein
MKIVLGSNPNPPNWGSQFGAAGRAADGVVVVVVEVVLGVSVEDGTPVVDVVVDVDVLDKRGRF